MSVREYIGARYVPIFGRMGETSVQWDNSAPYEPLTVVLYQGNSYTSRQYVPAGIAIDNTDYWVETGNYNAQIEAYRQEVQQFDSRIDALEANGWVTTAKLADNAVTSGKIADGSITYGKMSEGNKRNMWSEYLRYYDKNVVFFGDSYLAPNIENSEHEWLAQELESVLGMHRFNYAFGGAGFGRPSNPISKQQNRCDGTTGSEAMTADEMANTALVICMAGCNDLLNVDSENITQSMITTGINNFIVWANNHFQNAKIIVIPFNWGFSKLTAPLNTLITNCMNSINTADHKRGAAIISHAWLWNLGINSRFRNQVHANTSGLRVILNHILNAIMGSDDTTYGTSGSVSFSNAAIRSYVCRYNVINGFVHLNGYLRPDEAQTGVGNQIELASERGVPAIITPNDSIHVIPLTSSSTGKACGFLLIRNNGSAVCKFADVSANEVCAFDITYQVEVGVSWIAP